MDYNSLLATVQSYDPEIAARTDIPLATLLVELEADLQPQIKHYLAETTVTVSSVGNVVSFPSNCLEVRSLMIGDVVLKPVDLH